MELFKVNASIEKLHSDKKNTDYLVINIPLASDYTLKYFPKDAEKSIINRSDFLVNNVNPVNYTSDLKPEDFD